MVTLLGHLKVEIIIVDFLRQHPVIGQDHFIQRPTIEIIIQGHLVEEEVLLGLGCSIQIIMSQREHPLYVDGVMERDTMRVNVGVG